MKGTTVSDYIEKLYLVIGEIQCIVYEIPSYPSQSSKRPTAANAGGDEVKEEILELYGESNRGVRLLSALTEE